MARTGITDELGNALPVDPNLTIQFFEAENGWVYVEFFEDSRSTGVVKLSQEGWLNLRDRIMTYHPNGYLRVEAM